MRAHHIAIFFYGPGIETIHFSANKKKRILSVTHTWYVRRMPRKKLFFFAIFKCIQLERRRPWSPNGILLKNILWIVLATEHHLICSIQILVATPRPFYPHSSVPSVSAWKLFIQLNRAWTWYNFQIDLSEIHYFHCLGKSWEALLIVYCLLGIGWHLACKRKANSNYC